MGLRKAKKALAEVVQAGEEHHADKHGRIVACAHCSAGKQTQAQRLGNAVSDEIANGDVRREAHGLPRAALPALKREVLVEEKAQILVST